MYADDAVIVCKDTSLPRLQAYTKLQIDNVLNCAANNKLCINFKKTQCLLFSNRTTRGKVKESFDIKVASSSLEVNTVAKYLGVLIDNQLSWKNQITAVANKLSIVTGILGKLKRYVPQNVLKTVYHSIGYPHLLYGISNWGNAAKKYLNVIQVQQNKIIKILTKSSTLRFRLAPLYNQLSLLKIPFIYKAEVCKFMYCHINNVLPVCFKDFFMSVSDIHSHQTRHASKKYFSIPRSNKSLIQRSITIAGTKNWNFLRNNLQILVNRSKTNFNRKIKKYFIIQQKCT